MRASLAACMLLAGAHGEQILLAGDSWTGGGSVFQEVFRRHGDTRSIRNIGVGGSTCQSWAGEGLFGQLNRLLTAVREPDVEHVWFICGGNDALSDLLLCTPQDECVARLIAKSIDNVRSIITAVREANPRVRISGFGYDLFPFGALHCNAISLGLFPACLGQASCVNPEFYKIQGIWDQMAREFDTVDSTNILGAIQASEGVPGASIGHPNDNEFSPFSKYAIDCIHPNRDGYDVIFEAYYNAYWASSKPHKVNVTGPHPHHHHSDFETPAELDERRSALLWKAYLHGLKLKAAANSTAH